MNIHEYQAKRLLKEYGAPVAEGRAVYKASDAEAAALDAWVANGGLLIATGMTSELTWGERIAATFDAPRMLIVIFVGGLLVQSLFHVTLMTLAAVDEGILRLTFRQQCSQEQQRQGLLHRQC